MLVNNIISNKYVGPPYCIAEMYAGHAACCPLVSHGVYADKIDRQTDNRTNARPLQFAFRYGHGKRRNHFRLPIIIMV